jgi:hypothetical protein
MCFVWLSEQRVTSFLYIFNGLVFITEAESVYCAVRTEFLYSVIKNLYAPDYYNKNYK